RTVASSCSHAALCCLSFFLLLPHPPTLTLFPYTTLFRSACCETGRSESVQSTIAMRSCLVVVDARFFFEPRQLRGYFPDVIIKTLQLFFVVDFHFCHIFVLFF